MMKLDLLKRWLTTRTPARMAPARQSARPMLESLENRCVPATGAFSAPVPISQTADGARSVVVADLDDDGDLDVVSASKNDDKIAWYQNNGEGSSFTTHIISTSAEGANCVAVADLDGDGDLDVLSSSKYDNKIAWYENSGGPTPTFSLRTISTSTMGAYSVAAADIDGDGDQDVVSAGAWDNKIRWYENSGAADPTFTPHVISSTAMGAFGVAVADLDGDDDIDVLSASFTDDKIAWYENNGDGSGFTLHTISLNANGAQWVEAADIDGDGDLDVLSASFLDNTISLYKNNGDGSIFTEQTISTTTMGAYSATAADIDGDGDLDILTASYNDDRIRWFENTLGDGSIFNEHIVTSETYGASSAVAGDIDGDGELDVISAGLMRDRIAWSPASLASLTATGSSKGQGVVRVYDSVTGQELVSFTAYNSPGYNGGARVSLGDVNGDMIPDLIVAPGAGMVGGAVIKIYDGAALVGGTTTLYARFRPYGTYSGEVYVASANLSGDNRLDIITSNVPPQFRPTIKVFDAKDLGTSEKLKPTGITNAVPTGFTGGARIAVGDVNGDETMDLILSQAKNGSQVVVIDGRDFSTVLMQKTVAPTPIKGGVFVAVGNIDGDERADIIVGYGNGAKSIVQIYEDTSDVPTNTKATLLMQSAPIYGPTYKGGIRVAAGDLDGDGLDEVFTTAGNGLSSYRLKVLNGLTLSELDEYFTLAPDFTDPRFLAVGRLG